MRAEGYRKAEVWLEPFTEDRTVEGIRVELLPADDAVAPPRAVVAGRVVAGGRPRSGIHVTIVGVGRELDRANVRLHRGAPVPMGGWPLAAAVTDAAGRFRVELPDEIPPTARVVACVPGAHPAWSTPCEVGSATALEVDVGRPGGGIAGVVADLAPAAAGRLHAVIFDAGIFLAESPVDGAGRFAFADLPVGRYGLRLGDDVRSADPSAALDAHDDRPADPWRGATLVDVAANRVADVRLAWSRDRVLNPDGRPGGLRQGD